MTHVKPIVYRAMAEIVMQPWAQRCIAEDYPCMRAKGGGNAHRDIEGVPDGTRVFGLIFKSDDHALRSDSLGDEGLPLLAGDMFSLDPLDLHWTNCPSDDDELCWILYYGKPEDDDRPEGIGRLLEYLFEMTLIANMGEQEASEHNEYRQINPFGDANDVFTRLERDGISLVTGDMHR